MKKSQIKAVELVRQIRDRQSQETADKSVEEKIIYFRKKAQALRKRRVIGGA